jgi:hypothetical protein
MAGSNRYAAILNSSPITGTHTGSANASVLTDSTKALIVNGLVGKTISNTTDGSSATITANTATTITGTLSGGSENDWDASDAYTIYSNVAQSFYDGTAHRVFQYVISSNCFSMNQPLFNQINMTAHSQAANGVIRGYASSTGGIATLVGVQGEAYHAGAGNETNVIGVHCKAETTTAVAGNVTNLFAHRALARHPGTGTVTQSVSVYGAAPDTTGGGTTHTAASARFDQPSGAATNNALMLVGSGSQDIVLAFLDSATTHAVSWDYVGGKFAVNDRVACADTGVMMMDGLVVEFDDDEVSYV